MLYKEVAKKHRIGVNAVSVYVNKARKNREFMNELYAKSRVQQTQKNIVCSTAMQFLEGDGVITNCKDFLSIIKQQSEPYSESITVKFVQETLKNELNMSYRKMVALSPQQNSDQNLILRQ